MDELVRVLINRLVSKGMEITSIPAYVRDLANTISANGHLGPSALDQRLQALGWDDFKLDEYTLELVAAMFEQDIEYKPPSWFERAFSYKGIDDPIFRSRVSRRRQ